ncbi:conserved protein, unknown function [Plasmodium relictum]|uniref:U3 small nucleolar RNA-associated protein 25 n=1 Tax=Plasmodium relictum TaxID=85471 RepID=A0A1J1H4W9_PLARL|nr:conserved protein, unknown function [Plasmodium relictum]CRG99603.1 conserved protein, unknown function [Plasmodium relictum]
MSRNNRKNKKRATLNELYELEFVKKEKKKLKKLNFYNKKDDELIKQTNNENNKENKLNGILLKKYEQLKKFEEQQKCKFLGEEKKKRAYEEFLKILKDKKKKDINNTSSNEINHSESVSSNDSIAYSNKRDDKNEQERTHEKMKQDQIENENIMNNRKRKNNDEIYMFSLIKNIKNQNNYLKINNENCNNIFNEMPINDNNVCYNKINNISSFNNNNNNSINFNKSNITNNINIYKTLPIDDDNINFNNNVNNNNSYNINNNVNYTNICNINSYYCKIYNANSIYSNYNNETYKLYENKMDYYFTFCQNIDERFIEEFCKKKLNKKKKIDEEQTNKNKTIENIYVSSNLFLETNIFKKKENSEKEYTSQIFNNIEIKPHFFCNYFEKNHISYYLMNILDTEPKCILDEENFYNIDKNITFNLKRYLAFFKHPIAYFSNVIYKYIEDYYNIKIKKIVHNEREKEEKEKKEDEVKDEDKNEDKKSDDNNEIIEQSINLKTNKKKKKIFFDISDVMKSEEMKSYFHYINSYVDVLYANKNVLNSHFIRLLNSIHILNHLKKKRKRRKYINKKIEKLERVEQVKKENIEIKEDFCDESFARPKILILCSFRYITKEYIDLICNLLTLTEVKNKNKFLNEYDITKDERKKMKEIYSKKRKTLDYINLYRGNNDDCFRCGIKLLENEKKIQLYSPFYDSDILICSPLGLDIIIKESKKEEDFDMDSESSDNYDLKDENISKRNKNNKSQKQKKKKNSNSKKKLYEYDFLSSIEILIIDQIDTILMQNLLILKNVLNFINKPLLRWGNANINRIPKYIINGFLKNYRQTIISSSILDTNFISLIQSADNFRSYLKLFIKNDDNILLQVRDLNINQYFKKIECDSILKIEESIIDFISTNVIDILSNINQLIIFLPTYIEYIRIYEILKKNDITFKGINEYTDEKKRIKILKLFKFKRINILLITGRLMFYERCTFKGANNVIFFSPPKFIFMYYELIKDLTKNSNSSSICYYTKYHTYELERIVGQSRALQLIKENNGKITLFK